MPPLVPVLWRRRFKRRTVICRHSLCIANLWKIRLACLIDVYYSLEHACLSVLRCSFMSSGFASMSDEQSMCSVRLLLWPRQRLWRQLRWTGHVSSVSPAVTSLFPSLSLSAPQRVDVGGCVKKIKAVRTRAACPRITSLTDGQLVHGPGITLLNSGLTCVRPLTLRNAEMSNRSNKHFKQCNVCSGRPARFTVAYVINNNRLRSTFSTIEANYWQTRSIARPLCDISTTCCQ